MCTIPSSEVIVKVKAYKISKAASKHTAAIALIEYILSTVSVTTVYFPPTKGMVRWTKKENMVWLETRDIMATGKAVELNFRVEEYRIMMLLLQNYQLQVKH